MKKLLLLTLVGALMLLVSGSALAAIHNVTGDFTNYPSDLISLPDFDGWYTIDHDRPGARVDYLKQDEIWGLGGEYYGDDQTFADLFYTSLGGGDYTITGLRGSYKWANGLFLGLDYYAADDNFWGNFGHTTVDAGYRWDIDSNGSYLATSVDYVAHVDNIMLTSYQTGVLGYELDLKHFTDTTKVLGQFYFPNKDVYGDVDNEFALSVSVKLNDNYTLGAGMYNNNYGAYDEIGVTAAFDALGAEARYRYSTDGWKNVEGQVMYSFTDNFRAGIDLLKQDGCDDPYVSVKVKYTINDAQDLKFIYQLKNDSAHAAAMGYLRWDVSIQ